MVALFVVGSLLLGKLLVFGAFALLLTAVLYYFGWRGLFPQPQDPHCHVVVRVILCAMAVGTLLNMVARAYELYLQCSEFLRAVF